VTAWSLPVWGVAVIAAFAVVVGALALVRSNPADGRTAAAVVGGVLLLVLALFGLGLLDHLAANERAAERRALDARAFELAARALAPGSALGCLDGIAGETVAEACEKSLFASPEATAAAVSYVAAQLSLLAASREHGLGGESVGMVSLRRALEADRFGIVAHVLATRDGCTASQCGTFLQLQDPSRISANLARRTFETRVEAHMAGWPTAGNRPVASGASAQAVAPDPAAVARTKTPNNLYFPSSASIPPVSIMTAEPTTPPPRADTTGSADPAAARKPPAAGPQGAAQSAVPPAPPGAAPARTGPLQLTPGAQ
jgi:hypothetical protein